MIESRLLQHAVTLAEQGSFALAALALGLSQPALSRSIQSLETQLGVALFNRGHRRIEPTDAGQIFLEHAREILARNALLESDMGLGHHAQSKFTLAVGPYVADPIAAPLLARLSRNHPEISFRLVIASWADAVKSVRAREADLGIADISQLDGDPDLGHEPLPKFQGHLIVRASHPLLRAVAQPALSGAEIFSYPLVHTARLPPRILGPLQQERGPTPNGNGHAFPAVVCEHVSVMKSIVAQSDAVGIFVLSLIEDELRRGTLVPLPYHLPWLHTQFGIVHHRRRGLTELGAEVASAASTIASELEHKELQLAAEFIGFKRLAKKKSG